MDGGLVLDLNPAGLSLHYDVTYRYERETAFFRDIYQQNRAERVCETFTLKSIQLRLLSLILLAIVFLVETVTAQVRLMS